MTVHGASAAVAASGAPAAARLVGIDAARGIALLGMFTAHLTDVHVVLDWTEPATWWAITAGRSSVLFAVLAGVSLALVTGRTAPVSGPALATARGRIAVRGALVALLGLVLMALETPVAVILATYGILFVVVLPALSWRRRTVLFVAGGLALVAMPAALATAWILQDGDSVVQQTFVTYPLVTFGAFVLVGIAVGRSDLGSRRLPLRMLGVGAALAIVAYTTGQVVTPGGVLFEGTGSSRLRDLVFASEPHSSTLIDVLGSLGVALAVIGTCCLLAPLRGTAAVPLRLLAGVGALPLSIYSAHLVVIALLARSGYLTYQSVPEQAALLGAFAAGAVVVGLLFRGRRGPLEAALAHVAATVVPGRRPPR